MSTALWPDAIGRLVRREELPTELVEQVMTAILSGEATDAQIAGFAVALRAKGETATELAALVRTMLRFAERVDLSDVDGPIIDTCGTGGDRAGTVNVSTMAALVAAAAGARVAKHGGRAASSQCGSADVLEALGVVIDLGPSGVERSIREAGIGFCFAPRFHAGLRFAATARRELGTPTTFNFAAPLANPAGVKRQIVGVSDPSMAERLAAMLAELGAERALVFYGHDGLDELTVTAQLHRARTARRRDHRLRRRPDRLRNPASRAQLARWRRRGRERRSGAQDPRGRNGSDPRHRRVELGSRACSSPISYPTSAPESSWRVKSSMTGAPSRPSTHWCASRLQHESPGTPDGESARMSRLWGEAPARRSRAVHDVPL